MAAYIALGASGPQEVSFQATSAGSADAGKGVGLDPSGRIDQSMMPVGVVADTYTGTASEALVAGAMVYVKADGQIANASAAVGGNKARGFVLEASASGTSATMYFEGRNTAKTGLTIGEYFLSDTVAGGVMTTPVSGAGKIWQSIGQAVSTSTIATEFSLSIIRA